MDGQVVRLAQQVRQLVSQVQRRVAPVDHLVVEQDQPPGVDQHIFRAVVAVDEREAAGAGRLDQAGVEGGGLVYLRRRVAVVWLDPQRLEERAVGKRRLDRIAL